MAGLVCIANRFHNADNCVKFAILVYSVSDVFRKKIFCKNAFFSRNSKTLTGLYSTKYILCAVILNAKARFKQNTDFCRIFRI